MKLNKILCAVAVIGSVFAMSSISAMADTASSSEFYTIGNPVNLETGAEVAAKDFTDGMCLAFPVEINSSTNTIKSFTLSVNLNEDVLTAGIDGNSCPEAVDDEVLKTATYGYVVSKNGAYVLLNNICDYNAKGKKTAVKAAQASSVAANAGNWIYTVTYGAEDIDLTKEKAELFILCTAKAAFTESGALNQSLFTIDAEKSNINPGNVTLSSPKADDKNRYNACEGAFKIVVNPTVMGEKYIHALHLYVNGVKTDDDITEYVEGETTFEFPVRLTDNKNKLNGVVPIVIKADIGGATGEPTSTDVTVASFNLDLSRTATDYTTQAESQTATAE